ncbi:MAG: 2-amino-4-hydroxy-6-hydroxymethyldihydropteridine diphosphokinase [Planctomycetota bacterium]|nr:2-amino-4-hydroxy-6-hydroxymethyldihydropteridine diphosphokinase [Planctomycetota bacterium]
MPVAIALGSNLGDRLGLLRQARANIRSIPFTREIVASSVFETAPIGAPDQGPYLNAALLIETELSLETLLEHLHSIERILGRERNRETIRWGPRLIDLDLLMAGDLGSIIFRSADLTVPHPHLFERGFVLVPLAEIVPLWVHPETETTVEYARIALQLEDLTIVAVPSEWVGALS